MEYILDNLILIWTIFVILTIIFHVWAYIDVKRHTFAEGKKNMWLILVPILIILGPLAYVIYGRRDITGREPKK